MRRLYQKCITEINKVVPKILIYMPFSSTKWNVTAYIFRYFIYSVLLMQEKPFDPVFYDYFLHYNGLL